MLFSILSKFFAAINQELFPSKQRFRKSVIVWFALSLAFASYYSFLALQEAFKSGYVVQDDAREYVFWMQRFVEADLLPNDLIANYFQSITPLGYVALYKLAVTFGINPLNFSKILPSLLSLITTVYCFRLSLKLFPIPAAAFAATLLLNQSLWFNSDLSSAVPRSFVYPFLLLFLNYLLQKSWRILCVITVLEALFYPPLILISTGILCIRLRRNYLLLSGMLALGFVAILPYALSSSEYGPVVTASQAWKMPELWTEGRHPFFDANPWRFWLIGQHSGIFPPLMPPLIWMGLLLPWVMRHPLTFPLLKLLNKEAMTILAEIVIASFILYFAAHALLLKIFFPTRYTVHTLRIVFAIASSFTITIVLHSFLNQVCNWKAESRNLALTLQVKINRFTSSLSAIAIVFILVFYPIFLQSYPRADYKTGQNAALYKFLDQQPKDSLIASLSEEANNLPTFAKRAILVGREYALPFHLGYYSQIHQRTIDLITAQYSLDLTASQELIKKYGVSFWLLEVNSFQPEYLTNKSWLKSFQPAFDKALENLQTGKNPALAEQLVNCRVLQTNNFILLKTNCKQLRERE
jgi:hypothetical protein